MTCFAQRCRKLGLFVTISLLPLMTGQAQQVPSEVISPQAQVKRRSKSPIYLSDNSDWWSMLRSVDSDQGVPPQEKEAPAGSLTILGVDLENNWQLSQALSRVGPATVVGRGDAATARGQVCYVSEAPQRDVYLIFEEGEVNESFYLFKGGPRWNGESFCTPSKLVSPRVKNNAGLGLGQTPAQVAALLGRPSLTTPGKLLYAFALRQPTPAKDFERARKAHPELSKEELRKNYGSYDLYVEVEVRFDGPKSTYIGVLWSATY
jgi:hypothetical protein